MKKIIKTLFSNDDSISSKRVFGALIILFIIGLVGYIKIVNTDIEFKDNDVRIIETMLWISGILVAGGSLEKAITSRK